MSLRPPSTSVTVVADQSYHEPLAVEADAINDFVCIRIGPVAFCVGDLAAACDLNERIAVELSRLLADARQAETLPLGGVA